MIMTMDKSKVPMVPLISIQARSKPVIFLYAYTEASAGPVEKLRIMKYL